MALDISGNALPPSLLSKINERCESPMTLPSASASGDSVGATLPNKAFYSGAMVCPELLPPDMLGALVGGSPLHPPSEASKDWAAGLARRALLPLPLLRPLVRMPQSRHVLPVEDVGDGAGAGEARSKVRSRPAVVYPCRAEPASLTGA